MAEINLFRSARDQYEVPAGTVLFEQGDPAEHLYGVISGTVEIVCDGDVVETVGPGGVFGEVALLVDHVRAAGARVASDAVVAKVDEDEFLMLVKVNGFFAIEVMRLLAKRLLRDGYAA